MQRYRVVILIVLFGILPLTAAFVFALFFLEEGPQVAEPAPPAVPAPPVAEAPPPDPPALERPRVLAAVRTLPVGSLIRADDLAGVDLDLELDPDAVRRKYVTVGEDQEDEAAADSLRGYAVREAIPAGQPLIRSAVVGPGQRGFLAAVLEPGTRAVAIEVGTATSQADLIDPGDRVDVILTAVLPPPGQGSSGLGLDPQAPGEVFAGPGGGGTPGEVLARTIVEDARVVAIDRTTRGVAGPPPYGEEEEVSRDGIVTAFLEVLPGEDDRLVLGGREGSLSLAIRSLRDASLAGPGGRRSVLGGGPEASTAAVKLREILSPLPAGPAPVPPEGPTIDDMTALEDRLRTELGSLEADLRAAAAAEEAAREDRMRTELDALEASLRAAAEAEEEAGEPLQEPLQVVRIFRGSANAERVCFRAGKAAPCTGQPDWEGGFGEGAPPGPSPLPGLPLDDNGRYDAPRDFE